MSIIGQGNVHIGKKLLVLREVTRLSNTENEDGTTALKVSKGHSSQVQQGSGIDVLQFTSNFHHLLVYMREAIPENFSSIPHFILIL